MTKLSGPRGPSRIQSAAAGCSPRTHSAIFGPRSGFQAPSISRPNYRGWDISWDSDLTTYVAQSGDEVVFCLNLGDLHNLIDEAIADREFAALDLYLEGEEP